jgi:hypothetical protein
MVGVSRFSESYISHHIGLKESHHTEICQSLKLGIQRRIKFRLPDASMRRELFALHFPNPERVKADYAVLAVLPEADGLDMLANKYGRKFSCPPTIVPPPVRGCVLLQICST